MQLTIDDRIIAVDVTGQGEPVIFIHGFPLDRRMWRNQVAEFSQEYRVITFDLRGFGESAPSPEVMTMEDYAADIAAILDELDIQEPVTLCGLSMGGYIAFAFYRAYQKRLRRLILCDTKAVADSDEKRRQRHAMAERLLAEGIEFLPQATIPALLDKAASQNVHALVEEMVTASSPQGAAAAARGMALRADSTNLLQKIDVPTLVICGEADQISPPDEMRKIAAAIPAAHFELIPGAGHLTPLENPAAVNQAIGAFLQPRP